MRKYSLRPNDERYRYGIYGRLPKVDHKEHNWCDPNPLRPPLWGSSIQKKSCFFKIYGRVRGAKKRALWLMNLFLRVFFDFFEENNGKKNSNKKNDFRIRDQRIILLRDLQKSALVMNHPVYCFVLGVDVIVRDSPSANSLSSSVVFSSDEIFFFMCSYGNLHH